MAAQVGLWKCDNEWYELGYIYIDRVDIVQHQIFKKHGWLTDSFDVFSRSYISPINHPLHKRCLEKVLCVLTEDAKFNWKVEIIPIWRLIAELKRFDALSISSKTQFYCCWKNKERTFTKKNNFKTSFVLFSNGTLLRAMDFALYSLHKDISCVLSNIN